MREILWLTAASYYIPGKESQIVWRNEQLISKLVSGNSI